MAKRSASEALGPAQPAPPPGPTMEPEQAAPPATTVEHVEEHEETHQQSHEETHDTNVNVEVGVTAPAAAPVSPPATAQQAAPPTATEAPVEEEGLARFLHGFRLGYMYVFDIETPVDDGIRFEYEHSYDIVTLENPLSFAVPVGRYHWDEGRVRIQTSPNRPVEAVFNAGYGTFYDGTRARVNGDVTVRFTKHFQTGLVYTFNNLRLPGGDEKIHVVRARVPS